MVCYGFLIDKGEYFEKGSTSGTTKGEGSPPKENELLPSVSIVSIPK